MVASTFTSCACFTDLPKGKSFWPGYPFTTFRNSTHTGSKLSLAAKYKSTLVMNAPPFVVQRNVCASGSEPHILFILTVEIFAPGFLDITSFNFVEFAKSCVDKVTVFRLLSSSLLSCACC